MTLGIYGTGGSGRELLEMIEKNEELQSLWGEIVFIDDTKEEGTCNEKRMMPFERFSNLYTTEEAKVVVAIGEPYYREMLAKRVKDAGYKLDSVISPTADISKTATIGEGVVIKGSSIISAAARVSDNVWIQDYAIVGHDVIISPNCQISSFSLVAGRTIIEKNVYIGVSACIREDLKIGHDSIISMGAIVLKDVDAEKIAMGNPARIIAENKNHKVFKK